MKLFLKTLDQIKEEFGWEQLIDGIYVYHKQEDISSCFPHTVLSRNRYYISIEMYEFFGTEIDVDIQEFSIYHYKSSRKKIGVGLMGLYNWDWRWHRDWFVSNKNHWFVSNNYWQDFLITNEDFK